MKKKSKKYKNHRKYNLDFVSKHMFKFNKHKVFVDRKKSQKRGYKKHKGESKDE